MVLFSARLNRQLPLILHLNKLLLTAGFYLAFFVLWGSRSLKKFGATQQRDKIYKSLLGGHAPSENFEKIVQDWLKSHFWTLVAFTDSLISSSNKISISFFFRKNFWGKMRRFGGSFPPPPPSR